MNRVYTPTCRDVASWCWSRAGAVLSLAAAHRLRHCAFDAAPACSCKREAFETVRLELLFGKPNMRGICNACAVGRTRSGAHMKASRQIITAVSRRRLIGNCRLSTMTRVPDDKKTRVHGGRVVVRRETMNFSASDTWCGASSVAGASGPALGAPKLVSRYSSHQHNTPYQYCEHFLSRNRPALIH